MDSSPHQCQVHGITGTDAMWNTSHPKHASLSKPFLVRKTCQHGVFAWEDAGQFLRFSSEQPLISQQGRWVVITGIAMASFCQRSSNLRSKKKTNAVTATGMPIRRSKPRTKVKTVFIYCLTNNESCYSDS
jgi:hypothetical protein